jgi:predicted nucleic acid-binding protein
MIVVDTNIIVHLHLTTEWSRRACDLLQKDADWSAPLLWRSEFRNTLTKSIRAGFLDLRDALQIMAEAEILISDGDCEVASDDVLELAAAAGCAAYDAEFVVLARDLGVPLVTTDQELLEKFPGTAVSPARFLAR